MVIFVAHAQADAVEASLRQAGESPWHVGRLDLRQGPDGVRVLGRLTP
jgi:hypothetical protein